MITLRPYQERAIASARASIISGKRAPLIVAPTGAGKTTIAAAIVASRIARGGTVCWLAHRRELITQAASTLENFGVEVGYLGRNPGARVQVVSVQTVLSQGKAPEADMLVPDEAHHYAADRWSAVPKMYLDAGAIVLGLTATPERGDGIGLHNTFDDMIVAAQIGELVELGHLLPSEIVCPTRTIQGGTIAQRPVDAWKEHGEGRSTVVFASNVLAAETFAREFVAEGIRAEVVHGELSAEIRDERLAAFASGSSLVIVNVGVLTEGWDCPRASCCIFARSVGSTSLYLQMVGRILRPYTDGDTKQSHAKVIDLTGVVKKHGPPEEEREYFLEGQAVRRKGETTSDRFCRICRAVISDGAACACGAALGGTEVPDVAGVQLDKFAWAKELSNDKRVNMLARWLSTAEEKRHKIGHVKYKYKAVFKQWPTDFQLNEARKQMERLRG